MDTRSILSASAYGSSAGYDNDDMDSCYSGYSVASKRSVSSRASLGNKSYRTNKSSRSMSCGGSVKSVVSSSSSTQSSNQSALQSSIGKNSLYTDRSMSALAMEKQQIEAQLRQLEVELENKRRLKDLRPYSVYPSSSARSSYSSKSNSYVNKTSRNY